jgi:hypothetical protein
LSILKDEQVLSSWGVIVAGGDGKGETVIKQITEFIEKSNLPKVKLQHQNVSPGVVQSAMGGSRKFLVVTNNYNPNVKSCKLYINARDYGSSLQVCWYLVQQPTFGQKIIAFFLRIPIVGVLVLPAYAAGKMAATKNSGAGIIGFNLFDEQDLTAFTTIAHHCVQDAVDKLTKDYDLEMPRVDRTSKGFLNIT